MEQDTADIVSTRQPEGENETYKTYTSHFLLAYNLHVKTFTDN